MYNNNLPDDCQGSGSHLPWNEPEQTECPKCNSSMSDNDGDLVCDDEFGEYCDYVIYAPDEDC